MSIQLNVLAFTVSAALALSACASSHDPEEPIVSGIYGLNVRSVRDDCSPARALGEMSSSVSVVRLEDFLSIPVPEDLMDPRQDVTRRVSLASAAGFHLEHMRDMEECASAQIFNTWTLMGTERGSFQVEHGQRFEGLALCGPMEGAPTVDCESIRSFDYSLVRACEAPCELIWAPTLGAACACR